jgi:hypothetical protein
LSTPCRRSLLLFFFATRHYQFNSHATFYFICYECVGSLSAGDLQGTMCSRLSGIDHLSEEEAGLLGLTDDDDDELGMRGNTLIRSFR